MPGKRGNCKCCGCAVCSTAIGVSVAITLEDDSVLNVNVARPEGGTCIWSEWVDVYWEDGEFECCGTFIRKHKTYRKFSTFNNSCQDGSSYDPVNYTPCGDRCGFWHYFSRCEEFRFGHNVKYRYRRRIGVKANLVTKKVEVQSIVELQLREAFLEIGDTPWKTYRTQMIINNANSTDGDIFQFIHPFFPTSEYTYNEHGVGTCADSDDLEEIPDPNNVQACSCASAFDGSTCSWFILPDGKTYRQLKTSTIGTDPGCPEAANPPPVIADPDVAYQTSYAFIRTLSANISNECEQDGASTNIHEAGSWPQPIERIQSETCGTFTGGNVPSGYAEDTRADCDICVIDEVIGTDADIVKSFTFEFYNEV